MKLTHKDRWEQGFAALSKFRRRKGHCCPPLRHVEGKYNLGPWVITGVFGIESDRCVKIGELS
ncbi:MAG: helicase associated domain-containing protein [Xanthobacteraceae bacterium]